MDPVASPPLGVVLAVEVDLTAVARVEAVTVLVEILTRTEEEVDCCNRSEFEREWLETDTWADLLLVEVLVVVGMVGSAVRAVFATVVAGRTVGVIVALAGIVALIGGTITGIVALTGGTITTGCVFFATILARIH